MSDSDDMTDTSDTHAAPNTTGKRYTCATCGTQIICVKGGAGRVHCHGAPIDLDGARPLPSSD